MIVRDGANDQGQGHRTTWGILLADALGLPVECVELELGDTATCRPAKAPARRGR